jgi:hypothetical protein
MDIFIITRADNFGFFCEASTKSRKDARWLRADEVHPDLRRFGSKGILTISDNGGSYLAPIDSNYEPKVAVPSIRPEIMEFARLMEQHMRDRETYCAPYMELDSYSVRRWLEGLLDGTKSMPSTYTAGLALDLGAGAMMLRNLILKEAKEYGKL